MDDVGIVTALRARDPAGLAAAYDEYADRLVAYCAAMLQDRHAAADAVHDTFVVAYERAGQLRDPGKLRSWLYAIARNECLRLLRGQQRTGQLDEAIAVSDDTVELDAGLRDEQIRELVWSAANGLNPREREVLDLAVRHELEMSEVARALGVPAKHAHALLSKARQQLERAVTVLIVARTGRRDCAELDGLLSGWDGGLTVLLRKRVARHIDGCLNCSARRRSEVNAEALLASVPLLLAPLTLRDEILATASGSEPARAALADRAGRFDRQGFPVPLDAERSRFGIRTGPAAAALALTLAVVGGVFVVDQARSDAPTEPPVIAPTQQPTPTPTVIPTTQPAPRPTSAPRDEPEPTVPPGTPAETGPRTPTPTRTAPTSLPTRVPDPTLTMPPTREPLPTDIAIPPRRTPDSAPPVE
ncbi:MAG TPA: sigma-70 family RNA polymerase sigma factor [Jiangellaceae bacterium]